MPQHEHYFLAYRVEDTQKDFDFVHACFTDLADARAWGRKVEEYFIQEMRRRSGSLSLYYCPIEASRALYATAYDRTFQDYREIPWIDAISASGRLRLHLQHLVSQDLLRPLDGEHFRYVDSIQEGVLEFRSFIERNGLGSGNLPDAVLYDSNGDGIARISCDGHVWFCFRS